MLALTDGKRRSTIVSKKLQDAYDSEMEIVETSHEEVSTNLSKYWWALYTIKDQNLWRAKFDENQYKEWVGELCSESFGPKRSTFYSVMGAIDRFKRIGKTDDEIKNLLGNPTTAILGDFKLLFENHGKGDLLPEALAQIEAGGETPSEFLDRVSKMNPGEARREVLKLTQEESVFFMEDSTSYDELNGRLMTNVQWETKEDGVVYRGTVVITATEITEPRKHTKKKDYLPRKVAEMIMKKLNISE